MTVHRNARAFQALRGRRVHFLTYEYRGEFTTQGRSTLAAALDIGVKVVGTNHHRRYHLPPSVSMGEIIDSKRDWGYGMVHSLHRCPDIGVRFLKADSSTFEDMGGRLMEPQCVVLMCFDGPPLGPIPEHGDCHLRHYSYDCETQELSFESYASSADYHSDSHSPVRACLEAWRLTGPEKITVRERGKIAQEQGGVRVVSVDGVCFLSGLTPNEALRAGSHAAECRSIGGFRGGTTNEDRDRLLRYRGSKVTGFPFGSNLPRVVELEYRPDFLRYWEAVAGNASWSVSS